MIFVGHRHHELGRVGGLHGGECGDAVRGEAVARGALGLVVERLLDEERSLNEAREDLDDAEQLVSQQALYTDFLQSKLNEMESLALRAGADPSTVSEIMARKYKA